MEFFYFLSDFMIPFVIFYLIAYGLTERYRYMMSSSPEPQAG